jgi:drug/metabolite transporter (DMT)-like permease
MANAVTGMTKAIGLALIVVGAGMIFWGYQLSDSIGSQLTETLSGSMPDEVMIRYIGGAAALIVGLFLALRR